MIVNICRKFYKKKVIDSVNGLYRHRPVELRRNDYPIILVHGYFGYVPDQNMVFDDYFRFALQKDHENSDVYIASMSPVAGVHDRACELYQ